MKTANLFYQYYDLLYNEKDYRQEVDMIMSITEKFLGSKPRRILEIGCGTGNHTCMLAQNGAHITAIDTDEKMIEMTAKKLGAKKMKNVSLQHRSVEDLTGKKFDTVLAAFNVITYVKNMKALLSFFNGVSVSLRKGGIFFFDCWNGVAVIKDPPVEKTIHKNQDGNFVQCIVKPETDFTKQKCLLKYTIGLFNSTNNMVASDSFSIEQTLWTPMELEYCLSQTGFKILKSCKAFQPEQVISEDAWKIMFVCQKQ